MIRQNFILRDFIKVMKTMTGEDYQTTVMNWFEFACDVCEDNPAQLVNELEDVLRSLLFVKHNFRPEVLQESLESPSPSKRSDLRGNAVDNPWTGKPC